MAGYKYHVPITETVGELMNGTCLMSAAETETAKLRAPRLDVALWILLCEKAL
jgi:hypothetical protein